MIGAWLFAVIMIVIAGLIAAPCVAGLAWASERSGVVMATVAAVSLFVVIPGLSIAVAAYVWQPLCAWLGVEP